MKQEAQSAWNIGWMVSMLQLGYSLEDGLQWHANPQIVELNPNLQPKLPGTTGWITGDTTGGNHTWCMLYCMCILCRFWKKPQMLVDLSSECCSSFGTVHKDSCGPTIQIIDVLFPLVGWLIEGFEEPPLTTGFYDDRWYTKPAPLFLPNGHYWSK